MADAAPAAAPATAGEGEAMRSLTIPQALADDESIVAADLFVQFLAAREVSPRDSVPWEERRALEKATRATAAAAALPDLDSAVAADIVEAIHEELEAADREGLGDPYDEAAIGTAVYIVERLLPPERGKR